MTLIAHADLAALVPDEMQETYPEFCRRVWGRSGATERAT
jgi:hypothetical protein